MDKFIKIRHISYYMSFFNRFFSSTESIARESEQANQDLIKEWQQYVGTVPEKKNIADNFPVDTLRLRELIKIGIGRTGLEERDEEQIIRDLRLLRHDYRIKRVHRLQQALDYAETKYKYVYELLKQTYSILQIELQLANAIEKSENKKLAKYLQEQIILESAVLKKISEMNKREGPYTFARLFSELIRGEAAIEVLDEIAKKQFKKMQKIFSNEIPESITYKWVQKVLNSLKDRIHEAVADGIIPGYHPDIYFEFINRPMFVKLVEDSIKSLRTREVSKRMISIFVEDFRQGFNERGLN